MVREQSENGQSIFWPFSQPGPLGLAKSLFDFSKYKICIFLT